MEAIRRMKTALNDRNYDVFDELYAEDYATEMRRSGDDAPVVTRDDVRTLHEEYVASFPDYRDELVEIVADGDRVATYSRITGTHEGVFRGIEPTGKSVDYTSFGLYWFEDGKIVRSVGMVGWPTLLGQLGVELPIQG